MARRSALEVRPRALTVTAKRSCASWVVAGGWPWRTGRSIPYVCWRLCRGSVQFPESLTRSQSGGMQVVETRMLSHALACSRMLSHALACAMEPNDARRRASCQNGALHLLESPSQRRRWRGAPPAPAWHTTWTPSQTLATAAQRSACTSRCGAIGYATVHSAPSVLSGAATLDEAGSGLVILLLGHP